VVEEVAVRFAKQNAEASFGLASELANARDMQDVPGIPEAYALQTRELGRLMAEASQSMQPRG
jgi:hypothetical protein